MVLFTQEQTDLIQTKDVWLPRLTGKKINSAKVNKADHFLLVVPMVLT